MLISELIERLEKIRQKKGDLPVWIGVERQEKAGLKAVVPCPVIARFLCDQVILRHSAKWSKKLPKVVWL